MTKEVTVIIDGLQRGGEEDTITSTVSGNYHYHNGKHFVRYEERAEGEEGITKNTIKITPDKIDIVKTGFNTSQMVFDLNEPTTGCYQTTYGSLFLEIHTTKLQIEEALNEIRVRLEYTLSTNDSHLSDNLISIKIISKG